MGLAAEEHRHKSIITRFRAQYRAAAADISSHYAESTPRLMLLSSADQKEVVEGRTDRLLRRSNPIDERRLPGKLMQLAGI